MKKILCVSMGMCLLLSGCSQHANLTETESSPPLTMTNESIENEEEDYVEETTATDETILIDDSEMNYQKLLEKYKGTPYEQIQELDYVPRSGQGFDFLFYDTVTEIEEIGRLSWDDGTYVVVHFENEANNLFMYDKSRQGGTVWDPLSDEYHEYCKVMDEQRAKNSIPNTSEGDVIPEIGTSNSYVKYVSIQNVTDTGIVYNNAHYYEIDNGNGLKNLVYVPLQYIPDSSFPLYELGIFEENAYYNEEYNLKILSDRIEPRHNSVEHGTSLADYTMIHEELGVDNTTYFSIETYEYFETVTREIFDTQKRRYSDYSETGTDILCGKEYIRFENAEYGRIRWLRREGNKVYSLLAGLPYQDAISLISDYSE